MHNPHHYPRRAFAIVEALYSIAGLLLCALILFSAPAKAQTPGIASLAIKLQAAINDAQGALNDLSSVQGSYTSLVNLTVQQTAQIADLQKQLDTANATIAALKAVPSGAPTLTFTASPTSIKSPNGSILSWTSTNATACSVSPWFGMSGTTGGIWTYPTATTTWTMTCTGPGGTVSQSATVTVTP